MLFSFFDKFNILPPFTYEKVEKRNKIGTILIEHIIITTIKGEKTNEKTKN